MASSRLPKLYQVGRSVAVFLVRQGCPALACLCLFLLLLLFPFQLPSMPHFTTLTSSWFCSNITCQPVCLDPTQSLIWSQSRLQ